ncbi:MAG: adenylate/guanylate cyclase domain-containing protein [Chloroflexi bacterium]|nr:adenylate/guanylate cyclase domain-containing protein [Chloroflexota bacterium]MBU1750845.1 adenylate/guanylate cyclase domain-containing protein [Chloroflexota bacterium]MBU1879967.1 adenylate/guanylate cyclase domain-containing protein [Chloroflexota bacterium]
MTVKTVQLPRSLVTAIGLPTDSSDDALKKLVVLVGNLGGFFFSLVLMLIYVLNHLIVPAVFASIYLGLIALAYVYYLRTKHLNITAFLFSFLLFVLLVIEHVALGGFVASGVVFIWVAACALMAITAGQSRLAATWMILFLVTTSIFTLFEPQIAASGPVVSAELSRLLFAMNFGFGLTYMVGASFYFMYLLELARERADELLLNILPAPIARRLKEDPGIIADSFVEVTVLFADIVDFTRLCSGANPVDVVSLLNSVFSDFDDLAERYGLEKIKTIGDAYMVAGGLPEPRVDHCAAVAAFAFDMLQAASRHTAWNNEPIRLRVGMNTGPVVAGVIGRHKFIYDLWGDAVNTASRMESNGLVNVVQVTQSVRDQLGDKYEFEARGPIYVKGKGEMVTYLMRVP